MSRWIIWTVGRWTLLQYYNRVNSSQMLPSGSYNSLAISAFWAFLPLGYLFFCPCYSARLKTIFVPFHNSNRSDSRPVIESLPITTLTRVGFVSRGKRHRFLLKLDIHRSASNEALLGAIRTTPPFSLSEYHSLKDNIKNSQTHVDSIQPLYWQATDISL